MRKFGFHGTSHSFVASEAARLLERPLADLNIITAHLGNGCSVAAIKNGKCMDTSMGFSPLEGLMMGQRYEKNICGDQFLSYVFRSGDIDASVVAFMCERLDNMTPNKLVDMLNGSSGFLGVAGVADSRDVEDLYFEGDEKAILAVEMYCYRVAKYVASYIVALGKDTEQK